MRTHRSQPYSISILVVSAMILASCQGSSAPQTDAAGPTEGSEPSSTVAVADGDALRIGVWGPIEIVEGESILRGAQLAGDEINDSGGIDGREVVIISGDSEGTPEGASAAVNRLISDKADALIGGFLSGEVLAVVDAIADASIPFLNPGATALTIQDHVEEDYDRYKYLFRIGTNVRSAALNECSVIEKVAMPAGATHVGVIYDDRQWTSELLPIFERCVQDLGLGVTMSGYDANSTDFTANFNELMSAGSDWLVQFNSTSDAIIVGQQWGDLQIPAPLGGWNGQAQNEGFFEATNGAAAYMGPFRQDALPGVPSTDRTVGFMDAYQEAYGELPLYNGIAAYEAVFALKAAYEAADSDDADAIVEALEAVDIDGITGPVTFDDRHERYHDDFPPVLGVQLLPGGERAVVAGPEHVETVDFVMPPWIE